MVRLIFLLCYNIIRLGFQKLLYGGRLKFSWIERISPSCRIKLYRNGTLNIGRNCELASGCDIQVHGNGKMVIGNGIYMNRYCMVSAHGRVEIGDGCLFGPGVRIFDNNHRFGAAHGVSSELSVGKIKIGRKCWIASNVVLLKGADVGDNCVIGAGCVINSKIPAGSIVRPDISLNVEKINK